jgi:hypothetical protein
MHINVLETKEPRTPTYPILTKQYLKLHNANNKATYIVPKIFVRFVLNKNDMFITTDRESQVFAVKV